MDFNIFVVVDVYYVVIFHNIAPKRVAREDLTTINSASTENINM